MLLLFDAKHQYLGEVALTEQGALKSIFLTSKGDEEIGATVALWQTKGVSVKQQLRPDPMQNDEAFFIERIQPRMPGFKQACLSWAQEMKIAVIDLEDHLMSFWETLLRLPLTASERFTYLLGICRTSEKKREAWRVLFADLRYDDSAASKRTLNKLKVRLAKEMTSSFCDV